MDLRSIAQTAPDLTSLTSFGIDTALLDTSKHAPALLVVFAHPDDESFTIPGTIADAAIRGIAVHLVCATRGECGARPAGVESDADIGAARTEELLAAARVLGIAAVHFLPYHDSGMEGAPADHPDALARAPLGQVTEQITAVMRAVQPDTVITFGPYGGYGHPDHIAIHRATRAAFDAAGNATLYSEQSALGLIPWSPSVLYYTTFGTAWLRTVTRAECVKPL